MFDWLFNKSKNKISDECNIDSYLTPSQRLIRFNRKSTTILNNMMKENQSVIDHSNNIMDMNKRLIKENKKLINENIQLREIISEVNDMIYVTCPYCHSDKNIVIGKSTDGVSIINKLITSNECMTVCEYCETNYKVFMGKEMIETSEI